MVRSAHTVLLTCLALLAFASNSLLTRLALSGGHIDAASFTLVRLCSGAVMLTVLARRQLGSWIPLRGRDVIGPVALFAYAAPFSFAYLRIGAAPGALVLFGVVQLTMITWGIVRGERLGPLAWLGMALALGGFGVLTVPSVARPDTLGLALMLVAGVAWAIYSIRGKSAQNALTANARNFVLSVPLAVLLSAATLGSRSVHARGAVLAVVSGAITSGLGYAIWYRALRGLDASRAAVVQLSVPVIAAVGAVTFLGETGTVRLAICGAAILGGVALVLAERRPRRRAGAAQAEGRADTGFRARLGRATRDRPKDR